MIKTISKINNNKTQTIQITNNPNVFFEYLIGKTTITNNENGI